MANGQPCSQKLNFKPDHVQDLAEGVAPGSREMAPEKEAGQAAYGEDGTGSALCDEH